MDEFELDPPRTAAGAAARRGLRRLRRVSLRVAGAPVVGAWSGAELTGQPASDLIERTLRAGAPAMVARLGAGELACVVNYLGTRRRPAALAAASYALGRSGAPWWEPRTISDLVVIAGFFPARIELLERFAELMLETLSSVDVLGSWLPDERIVAPGLAAAQRVRLRDLEPYYHREPWSRALAGRTVLVVHPFARTIAAQYARRTYLFADPDVLPEFELRTLAAVQSIAGTPTRFATWFDALDWMRDEVAAIDFDVALIGCGAYGFPLAAHVKALGRQVVHLGGATQILFGIKGRRWDQHAEISRLYNEHWVRPAPSETPPGYLRAEGGSYW